MRIPERQLAGLIGREAKKADAYETVLHAITESNMKTTHETELAHPTFNGEAFVRGMLPGRDGVKRICHGPIQSTCIIVHYNVPVTISETGMGTI